MKKHLQHMGAWLFATASTVTTALADYELPLPNAHLSLQGTAEDTRAAINEALAQFKGIGSFIIAVVMLFLLAMLIIHIVRFGKSGDNDQNRRQATSGLMLTLVAIALIGSIIPIVAVLVSVLNG